MRRSSLFGHVAELIDLVVSAHQPADNTVREYFRQRHYLGSHDRRFIAEYLYGTLRHYTRLQILFDQTIANVREGIRLKRAPGIGLCATYALHVVGEEAASLEPDIAGLWRTATPDIDPSVLLRSLQTAVLPKEILADPVRRIATEYSMPGSVVEEWVDRFGAQEAERLCQASNEPAPTTLRVNTLRCTVDECHDTLTAAGVESRRAVLAPHGLVLGKRMFAEGIRAFKEGFFEIQDEGSQLISLLTRAQPGQNIVDACAGAGGKTLHLGALMKNSGALLAMDTTPERLKNLRLRASRAGVTIIREVVVGDRQPPPEDWIGTADALLIDAPCSGIGTFRRNPGAKLLFSETFVSAVSRTQSEILDRHSSLLKPGGNLVYSTCTMLRRENEQIIDQFLQMHRNYEVCSAPEILRRQGVSIVEPGHFLLLLPHRHGTDGFFAAVLKKLA
jgi:16S rRNA (cytosine967-C5)-methyltransferase